MSLLSIEIYSDQQRRSLQRIKEKMSAAALRAQKLYKQVRQHERKDFQGAVSVFLPAPEPSAALPDESAAFQVWSYDISQGGIAFVAPELIPQPDVIIGLKRPDGATRWIPGRIVRSRQIPEESFYDYGVAFQRPVT